MKSFGILAVAVGLACASLACQPQAPPMDVYGSVPPFQLTDQTGSQFSSNALSGHVTPYALRKSATSATVRSGRRASLADRSS